MLDPVPFLDTCLTFLDSSIGSFLFVPFYAIWVTCLLPGLWATMLAGALYGLWQGSLLVFLGAFLGAEISFLLGRTYLRGWVEELLSKNSKLQAIEQSVSREGLKLILLTRLSPAFPFSLLNFAYGLSQVTFRDYTIGLIGILPGTIIFCGLGVVAGDLAKFGEVLALNKENHFSWISFVGLISTLCVAWLIIKASRKALDQFNS